MNHTLFEIMRFYSLKNVITEPIRICRTGHSLPRGAMLVSSFPPIVCSRTHVLFTLYLFACVYVWSTDVVYYFWFIFLRLLYPVLPVSLDCPFFLLPIRYFLTFVIDTVAFSCYECNVSWPSCTSSRKTH